MFFFNRKTIKKTKFLEGYTDYHSHILPGVDDGFQSKTDSLEALEALEHFGVGNVWLTPHTMEDIPNTTEELKARFEQFKEEYKGPIKLHLASEYMLDNLFEEHLANKDFLTLDAANQVLVETSYYNPPTDLHDKLIRLKKAGYFPVLAHPERYMYMHESDYKELRGMGVRFQLNLASLGGGYGGLVKKKALSLLKQQAYNYSGSDLHRIETLEVILDVKSQPLETLPR